MHKRRLSMAGKAPTAQLLLKGLLGPPLMPHELGGFWLATYVGRGKLNVITSGQSAATVLDRLQTVFTWSTAQHHCMYGTFLQCCFSHQFP